jgi:carboxypeptidase C (cathepsin A)
MFTESKEKDKQSDSSEEKTSKISKSSAESADKDQSAPIPKIKFGAPVKRTQTNDDASESQQSNGKSSVEDKEIENLELDDQAKEDDLLFPSNKTPQRCSSNSDCQNSLIGNYSTCNTDSGTNYLQRTFNFQVPSDSIFKN